MGDITGLAPNSLDASAFAGRFRSGYGESRWRSFPSTWSDLEQAWQANPWGLVTERTSSAKKLGFKGPLYRQVRQEQGIRREVAYNLSLLAFGGA